LESEVTFSLLFSFFRSRELGLVFGDFGFRNGFRKWNRKERSKKIEKKTINSGGGAAYDGRPPRRRSNRHRSPIGEEDEGEKRENREE